LVGVALVDVDVLAGLVIAAAWTLVIVRGWGSANTNSDQGESEKGSRLELHDDDCRG